MNALAMIEQPVQDEPAPNSPADLLRAAAKVGLNPEQLREMLAVQKDYEANEARKAFYAARAAFKAEAITILKDKDNKQYGSRYVSLGNLVGTVAPFLSKHGLSHEWDQTQEDKQITVTCKLSHALGHSESTSFTVPPDTSGAKNPIQQIKSAITYARATTFEGICGLASTDANVDDDGFGAGSKTDDGADALFDKINAAESHAELQKLKPEIEALSGKVKQNIVAIFNKRNHELKAKVPA